MVSTLGQLTHLRPFVLVLCSSSPRSAIPLSIGGRRLSPFLRDAKYHKGPLTRGTVRCYFIINNDLALKSIAAVLWGKKKKCRDLWRFPFCEERHRNRFSHFTELALMYLLNRFLCITSVLISLVEEFSVQIIISLNSQKPSGQTHFAVLQQIFTSSICFSASLKKAYVALHLPNSHLKWLRKGLVQPLFRGKNTCSESLETQRSSICFSFFKTKSIQERLLAKNPLQDSGLDLPRGFFRCREIIIRTQRYRANKINMDIFFLPQIRGNSGSSPKEENVIAANCNSQKINPTSKLSKGKKIRVKNGNLRTSAAFYTQTEALVQRYTSQVTPARGKPTAEYRPVGK